MNTDPGGLNQAGPEILIRTGKIPGLSNLASLGHSDGISTTLGALYHGHSTEPNPENNWATVITTPQELWLASTSGNDTSAGSGARSVLLIGLDSNLEPATSVVALSGQTAVSAGTWAHVRIIRCISNGTTYGSNNGTIWLATSNSFASGVPNASNHYSAVEPGTNISATSCIAVPAGTQWHLNYFIIYSGDTTKVLNKQFYQYDFSTGLFYELFDIHGKGIENQTRPPALPPLDPGDLFMHRCNVDTGTAKITSSISGFLIEA